MAQTLAKSRVRGGTRRVGAGSARWFGARTGGSFDCQPALQTALNELRDEGNGGVLYVEPGLYRLTGGLTVYRGVHIVGEPGATFSLDHATADFFTVDDLGGSGNEISIKGLSLEASVTNTGRCFYLPSTFSNSNRNIRVENCIINESSSNLTGRHFAIDGDGDFLVKGSRLFVKGTGANAEAIVQTNASGVVRVINNKMVAGSGAHTSRLLRSSGGRGFAYGNEFDVSAVSSGVARALRIESTATPWVVSGNQFIGNAGDFGMDWVSGAYLKARDNTYSDGMLLYDTTNPTLGLGSEVELVSFLNDTPGGSTTYDVPNHVRHLSLIVTATGNLTINMPTTGLYQGQPIDVTIVNRSGSTIGGYLFTNMSGFAPTSIADGRAYSYRAVYSSTNIANPSTWVLVGAPSASFTP